ncbi:AraC family transcriptional regulator [Streptomyces sp. NPDC089799]|uniref:helix-turn-helix transcriptional regulator n=1 Tax=Streptomyces sp. NPDC089799 TaxID=3155066 RepID=UPI003443189B
MTQRWNGKVTLEPGRLTFHGRIGSAHAHAHAAVQIVIVTSGTVELTDGHGHARPVRAAVIPARALHTVRALDARGTLVYCDTDSVLGRAVRPRPAGGDRIADWIRAAQPDGPADLSLLVATEYPATPAHPAVRAATARIRALLGGPVRLDDVAAAAGISPSRLGHLFAQEVGMSFPAYLRWARLRRAIELVRAGATLTRAAHGAGFSDSSHLTRVVHEMFGTSPSDLLRGLRWEDPATARPAPRRSA